MKTLNYAWRWLLLLPLGCASTGVGNPVAEPGEATLTLTVDSVPEPNATEDEQLGAGQLKHAILVFGQIELLSCDAGQKNVKLPGPFVVDLALNRVEPSLPAIQLPEGGICGLDATLAPAKAPAALAGRSIFFSGSRADGTQFMLFADMPGTLHLRPENDRAWSTEHGWLWAMRPRRWLSTAELDASDSEELDGGRVIVINADRHPLLYAAIRNRVASRSSLHLDLNDNLELDSDERTGDAFIGLGLEALD